MSTHMPAPKPMPKTAEEYVFFSPEAAETFRKLSEAGLTAVFLYSPNVYTGGTTVPYDRADSRIRTIAVSGITLVPAFFFSRYGGADCVTAEDSAVLQKDGRSFAFRAGENTVQAGETTHTLETAPVRKGEVLYLPMIETAALLGLHAGGYQENRLTVLGSPEQLAVLDKDPAAAEAGAYLVLGDYDPYAFTAEDYRAARMKWRRKLVGTPAMNDLTNETIAGKIGYVNRMCRQKWESMNRGDDRVILWGDHAPVESVELNIQFGGLRWLAKGWATCGSEFYHNAELKKDIIEGVRWMYTHMYGEAEIAGTGWRDAHLFNWYYWFVDAPDFLTDIFFMMEDPDTGEDAFTPEEKSDYLKCFRWVMTFMRNGIRRDFARSRIIVCTKAAIALCDPKMLYGEYVDYDMLLGLEEYGGGIRVDYVDWTHGFPYNTGYGQLNLDRVLYASSALAGTPLAFHSPREYNLFGCAKYMFEPAIYKGQGMVMLNGRNTRGNEMAKGGAIFAYMLDMIGVFGDDEDRYIRRMIRRNADTEELVRYIKGIGTIQTCTMVDEIMNDPALSGDNDYEYAHAWFTGDRAAVHRNDYAVGFAMTSGREFAYESINDANKSGWYTGDGAVYLYTNYDRHCFDGDNFITKNLEVAYHFPGTTEDERERVIRAIRSDKVWRPSTSFAGSVQFRDTYLTCAMDFESLHFPGPDENLKDNGYGGSQPVHCNDLRAKKAWFCFDNEIIALGAGITSTMDSPVNTTVEHRRIVKEEQFGQSAAVSGKTESLAGEPHEKRYENPDWVLMEGHAGYVFPAGGEVLVRRYDCAEAGGQPFLEVRLCHGKNPTDGSYAYGILPYADEALLRQYAENPDIEILSNTAAVQAVREKTIGVTGYVFHEPGQCGRVRTETSVMLMLGEENGVLDFVITDPTHELTCGTVVIEGKAELLKASPGLEVTCGGKETVIRIDFADANGRPFGGKLRLG